MRACGGISKRAARAAEPAARRVGRVELVDAELGAVRVAGHVDEQVRKSASTSHGGHVALSGSCAERDLELVELSLRASSTRGAWLGRPDEESREGEGERRVIVPVREQAPQQIRTRRIGLSRRRAAERQMVAAARPGMAAVEHELFVPRRQSRASS
jgi:hypothetical protein